mgnify:CR=1 FL=1
MYGTRDAANNWEHQLTQSRQELGATQGKASTCIHRFEGRNINACVHGDDVLCVGRRQHLNWLEKEFTKRYEVRGASIGGGARDEKTSKILNRTIEWTGEGITLEADP